MDGEHAIAIRPQGPGQKLPQVVQRAAQARIERPVPHWGMAEIRVLVEAARERGKGQKGERDALLIEVLFDAALRVSEALAIRPMDILSTPGGYRLRVSGKGGSREVAISASMVCRLQAFAYERELPRQERVFSINRRRAHQIVTAAATRAGLTKPPGVGSVHILRHSGALERLRLSGHPRSVQVQLGHSSSAMTLRYMRTLTDEEGLKLQEELDLGW